MKFLGNIIWLICRRVAYRCGISDIQLAADDYDNRYPFRVADIEIRNAGPLALRQPGDGQR